MTSALRLWRNSALARRIDAFHERRPLACSMAWGGAKGVGACTVAQTLLEKREEPIDKGRVAAFGLWSTVYCGAFLFFIYGRAFPRFFPQVTKAGLPHPNRMANRVKMVLLDNFFLTPAFFMPSYYLIKSVLDGGHDSVYRPSIAVNRAVSKYSVEWVQSCSVVWMSWIPIHCITFSVVPNHWRAPFCAMMSFFTMMLNSLNQARLEARSQNGESDKEVELVVEFNTAPVTEGFHGVQVGHATSVIATAASCSQ